MEQATGGSRQQSSSDGHARTFEQEWEAGKQKAAEVASAAAESLKSHADRGVRGLGDSVGGVGQAFQRTSSELRDQGLGSIAGYVDQFSGAIGSLGDRLRHGSVDELAAEARALARSHPAAFVLGSVAAGFLLTRLMRSTPRSTGWQEGGAGMRGEDRTEQAWEGGVGDGFAGGMSSGQSRSYDGMAAPSMTDSMGARHAGP